MERGLETKARRCVGLVWGALAAGTAVAALCGSAEPVGPFLTKATVRLAMLGFGAALFGQLLATRAPWLDRPARDAWTLGWIAFAVHVCCAFHYYHGWSHAHAFAHTQAVSGWGYGVYVSHLFTLSWGWDVLVWWIDPAGRARRPAWLQRALHGFWCFIAFNGMVVFETGFSRVMGIVLFTGLAALTMHLRRVSGKASADPSLLEPPRPASALCGPAPLEAEQAALQPSGRPIE